MERSCRRRIADSASRSHEDCWTGDARHCPRVPAGLCFGSNRGHSRHATADGDESCHLFRGLRDWKFNGGYRQQECGGGSERIRNLHGKVDLNGCTIVVILQCFIRCRNRANRPSGLFRFQLDLRVGVYRSHHVAWLYPV